MSKSTVDRRCSNYEYGSINYENRSFEMTYRIEGTDFSDFFTPTMEESPMQTQVYHHQHYTTPKGNISYKEHKLKNSFSIIEGRYDLQDNVTIFGKGDSSLLEIQFNLSDRDIFFKNKAKADKVTPARTGNISFLAQEENQADILFQKDITYDTFDIHLPVSILHRYAGESHIMDQFLEKIDKGISSSLIDESVSINSTLYNTIMDVKNCKFERLTRRIYLESKAYELIALLFNTAENKQEDHLLSTLDIEKMKHAAHIIQSNLEKPFTIIELSRLVGTNQTKLKYGFKILFNNTVFGYLQDIRMHKAKTYLLDSAISIQEITTLVGYQSTSNFSAAFKKHFGIPPNKLREK